jgi:hypothetical protein
MKQIEKHRLKNNWEKAQKIWKYKQKEYNLSDWVLVACEMDDRLAMCDYNKRAIFISTIFMRNSLCNYDQVGKALLHEIAHALTPGHEHDTVWKRTCIKIGGDGKVCGYMNPPGQNWAMVCRTCKWRNEYKNKPNVYGKVCGNCGNAPVVKEIK